MSEHRDQAEQRQPESIRRGFAEIEAGHHIPHEAVKAWLLSLGSDNELLAPQCACGGSHDERGQWASGAKAP